MPKCPNNTHTFYPSYINNHALSQKLRFTKKKSRSETQTAASQDLGERMSTGIMTVTCLGMLLSVTLACLRPQLLRYCN